MISILFFFVISIFFSFFISFFFIIKLNNYDLPGKNKVHLKKIITSAGFFPYIVFSVFLTYLIFSKDFSIKQDYFNKIPQIWFAPVAIIVLTIISFFDDFHYIPYQIRLAFQIAITFVGVSLFPINSVFNIQTPLFLGYVPVKIDLVFTIIFWVFIINSTNFIDGSDGTHIFQSASVFLTLSIIFYLINQNFFFVISLFNFLLSFIFLFFNFNKKFKMFMGDSGSIPCGFVMGWLLITLINMGYFVTGLLINIIFIMDVFITLFRRIINKKSIFERHNDFFFKKFIKKYGAKKYFIYFGSVQLLISIFSIYLIN